VLSGIFRDVLEKTPSSSTNEALTKNYFTTILYAKFGGNTVHYGKMEIESVLSNKLNSCLFIVKLCLQFVGYNLVFDRHPETRTVCKVSAFLSQFKEHF